MSVVDGKRVWSAELLGHLLDPEPGRKANRFRDAGGFKVLIHHDVLEQLTGEMDEGRRRRVKACLRELLAHGECNRRKPCKGVNRGWLRTQLDGTGGSHHYLWWAPHGYPPVANLDLGEGAVLVRAVRHHDDTSDAIGPGGPEDWALISPADALSGSSADLTDDQQKVLDFNGPPIRIVKGYPGSGKTTALLEAANMEWGTQVLYLTFSSRLQALAEQQLRTFTPEGVSSESMTFGQLLAQLGASGPGVEQPITLPKLIGRLESTLSGFRGKLGKWERRIPELYAQLHAYAFGQALPIDFAGVEASSDPVLSTAAFIELRRDNLGRGTAEKAASVARYLQEKDLVRDCFPALHAARQLLGESSEDLPPSIAGASVVLIDEVQDLTMVEAMLVLTVVGRIAREQSRMPYLFVAGDESQTVRPTAFTWDWFANLMTATLGPVAGSRVEVDLRSNLRSPTVVADLIQATRSHYQALDKVDRPGGMVYEDPELDRDGRLFYCYAPENDWAELVELFRAQSSAQLVYPGAVLPDDLGEDVDVATSDEVKGLGFDLVGVVDAGRTQEELVALGEELEEERDRLAGTLGRTLADQFRVAVSRAQENLVLIDRDGDRIRAIQGLADDQLEHPIERVDVVTLAQHLDGELDTHEWFESRLGEVHAILTDAPERALIKIRPAVDRMSDDVIRAELPEGLVVEVLRAAGVAAYLTAVEERSLSNLARAHEMEIESIGHLNRAGYGEEMSALIALREAGLSPSPEVITAAARAHFRIANELADIEALVRAPLASWFERTESEGLDAIADVDEVIAALDVVSAVLEGRFPGVDDRQQAVLLRSAEQARAAGSFDRALRLLDEVENVDVDLHADVLREAGRLDEAIAVYESEGRVLDALNCAREAGDLDRSIKLAEQYAPDVAGRLRWAQDLLDSLTDELVDHGEPLTRAEVDTLVVRVSSALERALAAEPSGEAPVNRWVSSDRPAGVPDELGSDGALGPSPGAGALSDSEGQGDHEGPWVEEPSLPASGDADDVATVGDWEESPPQPPPYRPNPAGAAAELIPLAALATELDIDAESLRLACRKLGVAPAGDDETLSIVQADRVRRRVAG